MNNNTHKIEIKLTIDELIIIMHCLRTSILYGKQADLASDLYDRLDKVIAGI